ncbi:MAG: adenylate/guanylate cyclase domain-containing protein [Acidimicrobiales bacterium]
MQDVEPKYLDRDGARIAYEVFGGGPVDLVVSLNGLPIDLMWDLPQFAHFMESLGSVARVIAYDERGNGASDPLPTTDGAAAVESAASDWLAVLDSVGSERASILSFSLTGPQIFAAVTYPERVRSIIGANLRSSFPEMRGQSWEQRKAFAVWYGTNNGLMTFNPRVAHDPILQRWWGRAHRLGSSPEEFARILKYGSEIDVGALLEHVRAPALVFHREGNRVYDIDTSRMTAARMPNCRFVELPGSESDLFLGDTDPVLAEITTFLREADLTPVDDDRPLATVLFTDIVDSTEQLAALGDRQWRTVLDDHDRTTEQTVRSFRGRVVKKLGDGMLATFDGPARAVRCAAAIRDALGQHGIAVRAGLHTGEIELRDGDVAGLAVHIASRISALAGPGEVLASRTVVDLTSGSGISYDDRGNQELKGIPGGWPIFAAHAPATSIV